MEGNTPLSLRGGRFAVALAVSSLAFTSGALAQAPLPPAGMTVGGAGQLAPAVPPLMMPGPAIVPGPGYYSDLGSAPAACRPEMRLMDTIKESLCGDASAEGKWRPLTLGTFFSEGWNEPWAGGPAGQSGLTPRHGWLGAFEGVFYRLWLVNGTYQNNVNKPYGGDAYGGNVATFLPFNRRFELYLNVPFINANGTEDPTRGYRSDFGDLQVAASFLLSESEACTQLFTLGATLPTGQTETGGGLMALFPRFSFWSNPGGAWVVRGGTGVNIPLNKNDYRPAPVVAPGGGLLFGESTAQTTYNAGFAVGRYFRPHDVPFGDLVFYVNSNVVVPLEDGGRPTYVGIGPGTRFQITGNWYFLNYCEFQVGSDKPFNYQLQAAIVKAW